VDKQTFLSLVILGNGECREEPVTKEPQKSLAAWWDLQSQSKQMAVSENRQMQVQGFFEVALSFSQRSSYGIDAERRADDCVTSIFLSDHFGLDVSQLQRQAV